MKTDILVLGGGPAGLNAAISVKKNFSEKEVLVVRKKEVELFPPKIPYIFGTLKTFDEATISTSTAEKAGVKFLYSEAKKIDFKQKSVELENGKIEYEKLIIAIGSSPIVPRIPGVDKEGVFVISKDIESLKIVLEYSKKVDRIVIVGGGFIGIELADELRKSGKEVVVIEALDQILATAFDEDIAKSIEEKFSTEGITVKTNAIVKEILGDTKANGVELNNGERFEADMVILSIGYKPNTELVKDSEILIGHSGGIWVDDYMRTNVKDVFAVGDCAEHKDFFTGKHIRLMLLSIGSLDSKILSENLYTLRPLRKKTGDLSAFTMTIEGMNLGAVGMNSKTAMKENFDFITGIFRTNDEYLKLIFSKDDRVLLGAQVASKKSIGVVLNLLKNTVQNKTAMEEILKIEVNEKTSSIFSAAKSAIEKIS
jgi:NADPH-dependent 2,4-dienoyl-CoA reductase/sulfur reductase-like enzyme